jgi:parvulin-like peptidyl-prolyl cis-trans isomerase-like protein
MKIILRKLIREPLFHFLLLGAVIFLLAGRVRGGRVRSGDKIVVTQSGIESMVVGFSRTWMRPPTQEELQGLVDDYVREEVLYREAKAMGLDQDDVIVRRRMRQKFEFLAEDLAARTGPPTDQELEAYLRQHADKYSEEASFSFEHIFLSREKRGASANAEAMAMLARLSGKGAIDIEKLGDPFLLPSRFEKISAGETARLFGEKFAKELNKTQLGTWAGPIESSYGFHLVRVNARIPEVALPLANVRESVLRDLLSDRRKQELDTQYERLRARYTVVVEPPEAPRVAEAR